MAHSVLRPKDYVKFDPANPEHQKVITGLLTEGRYPNDTRFMLEDPHTVVPTMCVTKLVKHFLQKEGVWPANAEPVL
jgi:hypothetical protein